MKNLIILLSYYFILLLNMGWHYILTFTCKILPEYIDFIEKKYLHQLFNDESDIEYRFVPYYNFFDEWKKKKDKKEEEIITEYNKLPKFYRDLIDIWNHLCIGNHFYEYDLKNNIFTCKISKRVDRHFGDLKDDYEKFLEDIIVPITSEIISCDIESDDCGNMKWYYTDSQLRSIYFNFQDKIKDIIHSYDDDEGIIETRVIYKHTIKQIHFMSLNRAYGK